MNLPRIRDGRLELEVSLDMLSTDLKRMLQLQWQEFIALLTHGESDGMDMGHLIDYESLGRHFSVCLLATD